MSNPRSLVVTGATGKQGGALISALLANPSQPFEIFAVTRNKNSTSAQRLATQPKVHVIEGDFDTPEAIFNQVDPPWGLFSVTMPDKGAEAEEKQGIAMTKAAINAGVQHIVFTATDRGGPEKSEDYTTNIPHFISKYNIEKDIIARASDNNNTKQGKSTTWTFLRPVAFMDNLTPNFLGKAFTSVWRLNGDDNKLQFIATSDIGRVAAEAFIHAGEDEYRNKGISLASDELTPKQAAAIFKEVTGQNIPETYSFIGWLLRWALKDMLGLMFQFFRDEGFGADVEALRRRYPYLKDFRTWLKEESAWKQRS